MKTTILLVFAILSLNSSGQLKGLEGAKQLETALEMYNCKCLSSLIDDGDTIYYMTFDSESIGELNSKYMETLYEELNRILKANGRSIEDPDMVSTFDYATYPVLKDIKKKLGIGYISEERFDYAIGDYVVAFMYTSFQYQIMIYLNPY